MYVLELVLDSIAMVNSSTIVAAVVVAVVAVEIAVVAAAGVAVIVVAEPGVLVAVAKRGNHKAKRGVFPAAKGLHQDVVLVASNGISSYFLGNFGSLSGALTLHPSHSTAL